MIYEINDICVIDGKQQGEVNVTRKIYIRGYFTSSTIR